mmetsp:Transcript_9762/g.23307  ORF Transcript_9762/g.23307 Transcript_9762/m.23307 type:complete len:200 (+) Transcript_9762:978-1577(+)
MLSAHMKRPRISYRFFSSATWLLLPFDRSPRQAPRIGVQIQAGGARLHPPWPAVALARDRRDTTHADRRPHALVFTCRVAHDPAPSYLRRKSPRSTPYSTRASWRSTRTLRPQSGQTRHRPCAVACAFCEYWSVTHSQSLVVYPGAGSGRPLLKLCFRFATRPRSFSAAAASSALMGDSNSLVSSFRPSVFCWAAADPY